MHDPEAISSDPFLDEIRALKRAHSARFNHDLRAIVENARKVGDRYEKAQAAAKKSRAKKRRVPAKH